MGILDNDTPIDEDDKTVQPLLAALQGNILRGHGRPHSAQIFFAYKPGASHDARQRTLRRLNERFVTSALAQAQQARDIKVPGATPEPFGTLLLSASGYVGLGLKPAALFLETPAAGVASTFAAGLRATAAQDFNDRIADWAKPYRGRIDGLLLLAHSTLDLLKPEVEAARAVLAEDCTIVVEEAGHAIRKGDQGFEHFGFADGRSQPLYLRGDFVDPKGLPVEPTTVWDPFAPLSLVLTRDPGVPDDPMCHGSFMVYRKLEQNVRGFKAHVTALADGLGLKGADRARAGAMVVGRFEDGTPLHLSPTATGAPVAANDFDYESDIRGGRCPMQAHIRKVNPRGRAPDTTLDEEKARRITRRGITYGAHVPDGTPAKDLPVKGLGVLFMCYQANIAAQFGFMQRNWANSASFPQGEIGADALGGQGRRQYHEWPARYGQSARTPFAFQSFITTKGGEFFFAPSRPFFDRP